MKTLIIYESTHHGNTKKLVDAIAEKYGVDTVPVNSAGTLDFSKYDLVGIAAGIAFGKLYKATEKFVEEHLPPGTPTFILYTCGRLSNSYTKSLGGTLKRKNCPLLGAYGTLGYDTFGPFKLLGGIAKGHPDEEEIQGALSFYEKLLTETPE